MTDEPKPAKRGKEEAPAPHAAHPFDVDSCYLTTLKTTLEAKHGNGCPLFVGEGYGLAFCQETGQLAQSRFENLSWGQPGAVIMFSIVRAKKTGTPSLAMQWETHLPFHQDDLSQGGLKRAWGTSGALAFTEDGPPLLLSVDHYDRFVRVLSPVDGTSLGCLAPPGGIDSPRGVSTWAPWWPSPSGITPPQATLVWPFSNAPETCPGLNCGPSLQLFPPGSGLPFCTHRTYAFLVTGSTFQ